MKIVLFDWNGTLFNDSHCTFESTKMVFEVFGGRPPTLKEYCQEFEGEHLPMYRRRGISASREEIQDVFMFRYMQLAESADLAKNAYDTLVKINRMGMVIGLITGNPFQFTIPFLKKFKLAPFFCYREFGIKDKSQAIRKILHSEGIEGEDCCYIGDMPSDLRFSKSAGVKPIAFFNSVVPLELLVEEGARYYIDDLDKIFTVFEADALWTKH